MERVTLICIYVTAPPGEMIHFIHSIMNLYAIPNQAMSSSPIIGTV